jgi:hypothetical protein
MNILTHSDDNVFFPIGALAMLLGSLVASVVAYRRGPLPRSQRLGLLAPPWVFLIFLMLAPPILLGRNEPTFVLEAAWALAWIGAGWTFLAVGDTETEPSRYAQAGAGTTPS